MKLTQKRIEKLQPKDKRYIIWDDASDDLRLGVRVTTTGRKLYILDYLAKDGSRKRMTVCAASSMPPLEAKKLARQMIAGVPKGNDPLDERKNERHRGMKLSELWTKYEADYLDHPHPAGRKGHKPLSKTTRASYRWYWGKCLEPALGKKSIERITKKDAERLHKRLGKISPTNANRTIALLGGMFSFSEHADILPRGSNPTHGMIRFEERKRERFLSSDELARLGEVLRVAGQEDGGTIKDPNGDPIEVKGEPWQAVEGVRLLLFSGMRKTEALTMRWEDVDIERGILNLKNAKGGDRPVYLNAPALALLAALPRLKGCPWVLPGRNPKRPFVGLPSVWERIRKAAGLDGVRLHDLRHSVASEGRMAGLPLGILQGLLGHKEARTTERYAHIGQSPIQEAAETIGKRIESAMAPKNDEGKAEVVEHPAMKARR